MHSYKGEKLAALKGGTEMLHTEEKKKIKRKRETGEEEQAVNRFIRGRWRGQWNTNEGLGEIISL